MDQKLPAVLLECSLKWRWSSQQEVGQEGQARLTDIALELQPKYGAALAYSYRDLAEIKAEDYRVALVIEDGESLELYHLGNKYSDFVRILISQRNELMLTDLLMHEPIRRAGINAACTRYNPCGEAVDLGKCELRLGDTALLIIPEYHEPIRLPLSYVFAVKEENYAVNMVAEGGERLVLSKLGRELAPFTDLMQEIMSELSVKAQTILRELLPAVSANSIQQAAYLMREGRAAKRAELEHIDAGLWVSLEEQLDKAGIRREYDFLSALADTQQQCLGFKRELVAVSAREYIWFLIPIAKSNLIAMEASSGPGSGRATYFFRIVEKVAAGRKLEQLQEQIDQLLIVINRCMQAINFRREPVYLPEEKLLEPRYQKYRLAVRKIPGLLELRKRFVGRVFHRNPQQWEQDVLDLLRFNESRSGEWAKWSKSDLETAEAGGEVEEKNENGG